MNDKQNATNLTPQQEKFLNFVASGQLSADFKKQSYDEFAKSLGVNRATLYNWRRNIPNFWQLVADRSTIIIDRRIPAILNAMLGKALKGDVNAAKLLLNQAGRLKPRPEISYEDNFDPGEYTVNQLVSKALGVQDISDLENF